MYDARAKRRPSERLSSVSKKKKWCGTLLIHNVIQFVTSNAMSGKSCDV